jgi:hypothetical protein
MNEENLNMRRILKNLKKLLAMLVVIILVTSISPLNTSAYGQEVRKPISYDGVTWLNNLNTVVLKYVMEFDPNLCGVSFDTSLLQSKDLSSIYSAIKEKTVWKFGKKPVGIKYPQDGPFIQLTQEVTKGEVLPLRFCDESLVRIICDFKVSRLEFNYNSIIPGSSQYADSTIGLIVHADKNVLDSLKSVLSKQGYIKFVERSCIVLEIGFEFATPPRNEKLQKEIHQTPSRDDPNDGHLQYLYGY